jgi:hypothetical protein
MSDAVRTTNSGAQTYAAARKRARVFAGLRLSVPYALIGAIVGEIIASNRGLGYLVSNAASKFDTPACSRP